MTTILTRRSYTLLFNKYVNITNCLREDVRKKKKKTQNVHTLPDLAFGVFY